MSRPPIRTTQHDIDEDSTFALLLDGGLALLEKGGRATLNGEPLPIPTPLSKVEDICSGIMVGTPLDGSRCIYFDEKGTLITSPFSSEVRFSRAGRACIGSNSYVTLMWWPRTGETTVIRNPEDLPSGTYKILAISQKTLLWYTGSPEQAFIVFLSHSGIQSRRPIVVPDERLSLSSSGAHHILSNRYRYYVYLADELAPGEGVIRPIRIGWLHEGDTIMSGFLLRIRESVASLYSVRGDGNVLVARLAVDPENSLTYRACGVTRSKICVSRTGLFEGLLIPVLADLVGRYL